MVQEFNKPNLTRWSGVKVKPDPYVTPEESDELTPVPGSTTVTKHVNICTECFGMRQVPQRLQISGSREVLTEICPRCNGTGIEPKLVNIHDDVYWGKGGKPESESKLKPGIIQRDTMIGRRSFLTEALEKAKQQIIDVIRDGVESIPDESEPPDMTLQTEMIQEALNRSVNLEYVGGMVRGATGCSDAEINTQRWTTGEIKSNLEFLWRKVHSE